MRRVQKDPALGWWSSRSVRRWGQRAGWAAALLISVERLAHWGVALGIALAPNVLSARHASSLELPRELAEEGALRVETPVGPPAATLVSWWLEPHAAPARGTIVLLHGVRMDRSSLVSAGIAFHQAGYRSILVDLRGHGESSGRYLTYGAVEAPDLSELLDSFAARGVPLGNVGVFGFSYGAAVALDLGARDERVCAVVAAAPFASLREVVLDYRHKYLPAAFHLIPERWFDAAIDDAGWLAAFNPDQSSPLLAVSRSRAHQLLLHGTSDTQVPLRHSVALSSLAGPRAELRTIVGAEHYDLPRGAQVEQEALRWFERWLAPGRCRD